MHMKIFRKENIMPLIGLGLTLFGLVMIIIAGDWVNIVWPIIVLFLIFKGFKKTDLYLKLQEEFNALQEVAIDAKSELEKNKNIWTMYQELLARFKEVSKLQEDASFKLHAVTQELDEMKSEKASVTAQANVPTNKKRSKKALTEIKNDLKTLDEKGQKTV